LKKASLKDPSLFERVLRLVYPMKCMFCDSLLPDTDNLRVCDACYKLLPRMGRPFYAVPHMPYINGLFAAYHYEDEIEKAIHAMKFQGRPQLSKDLAFLLSEELQKQPVYDFDLIVPVPMHRKKQRQRGYNQSQLLARELSGHLGIPVGEVLIKTRHTKAQSSLGREERLTNLEGAFKLSEGVNPEGMNILLLDDVTTTGSTLNACALVLYEAGTSWIFASVIAIAGN